MHPRRCRRRVLPVCREESAALAEPNVVLFRGIRVVREPVLVHLCLADELSPPAADTCLRGGPPRLRTWRRDEAQWQSTLLPTSISLMLSLFCPLSQNRHPRRRRKYAIPALIVDEHLSRLPSSSTRQTSGAFSSPTCPQARTALNLKSLRRERASPTSIRSYDGTPVEILCISFLIGHCFHPRLLHLDSTASFRDLEFKFF